MLTLRRILIGIGVVIALLVPIIGILSGWQEYTLQEKYSASYSVHCPVANTSHSFCIVRNGKIYYFSVEGWVLPPLEVVKNSIPEDKGLYIWLRVRTNLDLEFDADNNVEVLVGETYRNVLVGGGWGSEIRVGNDILLLPYRFLAQHEDIEALLNAKYVRLYFDVFGYYDVLPINGCIGEICFVSGDHGPGFYINYSRPPTMLKVLDIKGVCAGEETYFYNVTFMLSDGYLVLHFYFNEKTGKRLYADFPIHINGYIRNSSKLYLINEYSSLEVVPPLPRCAVDVWKEPEHEYVATIIPPGEFTLTFRSSGAVFPRPLLENMPVVIGTPWSGVEVAPQLKVVEVSAINAIPFRDEIMIASINVTLRNEGKIPIPLPQVSFPWDIYEYKGYKLLVGRLDELQLLFIYNSYYGNVNERQDTSGALIPAYILNPNETVTLPLTPIRPPPYEWYEDEIEDIIPKITVDDLIHEHVIEICAYSTNTCKEFIIPPLKPELDTVNTSKIYVEEGYVYGEIYLRVRNTWVSSILIDESWFQVYPDDRPLDAFYYDVQYYGDVERNSTVDVPLRFSFAEEMLVHVEKLRICIAASCIEIPLEELVYRLGDTATLENIAIEVLNATLVDAVGVRYQSQLYGEHTSYYIAPEGYRILIATVLIKNIGVESLFISSVDFDDSYIVAGKGIFDLAYLSELISYENITELKCIIIDENTLVTEMEITELRPGESTTMTLLFLVPKGIEIKYFVIEYWLKEVIYTLKNLNNNNNYSNYWSIIVS